MAKDGTIQAPRAPAAPIDEEEQFWNSELGRDMMRSFEEFQAGKKTAEQLQEEMSKKYGQDSSAGGARQVPNAPIMRVK